MNKRDIAIDVFAVASSQTVTVASITNPITSIFAVTAIAMMAGMGKLFLSKRKTDIEKIAEELTAPDTVQRVKQMKEQFLDDLYYSIEKILSQRTEPKRNLMRNVFLGYIKAEHKDSYPLERMYRVVENLTFADVDFFRRVLKAVELKSKYPIPWVSKELMDSHEVPEKVQKRIMILTYQGNGQDQQSKANLITEGLLVGVNKGVGQWSAGSGTPQIYITQFGQYFKNYLLELNDL